MRSVRTLLVATSFVAGLAACAKAELSAEVKGKLKDASDPVVLMSTSMGDITIELYKKDAPKTVDNFLAYAKKKHYDGTIFHRVIGTFMIQGGGMDKDMKEKATMPPVVNEAKLSNTLGTISMARTNDPNSATSQFFINVTDNSKSLDKGAHKPTDAGYAVFGKVVAGMDVVNEIKAVKTMSKPPHDDVPVTPVVIKSVTILQ
jgi:cyclophilin family peptidyl-prolyl cis-trans isomerase